MEENNDETYESEVSVYTSTSSDDDSDDEKNELTKEPSEEWLSVENSSSEDAGDIQGFVKDSPSSKDAEDNIEGFIDLDLSSGDKKRPDFAHVPFSALKTHPFGIKRLLFDSHCHLDRVFFKGNSKDMKHFYTASAGRQILNELMDKYPSAFDPKTAFDGCIHVITHPRFFAPNQWSWILSSHPNIWMTVGCHPSLASQFDDRAEFDLETALKMDKVVALGEIGLDDTWTNNNNEDFWHQQKIFEHQLKMAKTHEKALVLHIRGSSAQKAAMKIMKRVGLPSSWPIHMHCYSDNWELCQQWQEEWPAMKFGFTVHHFVAQVVQSLPLSKILLETDAPYFPPKMVCLHF